MIDSTPIVEIRAINYTWEPDERDKPIGGVVFNGAWRIEYRRAGETTWHELDVIEIEGRPPVRPKAFVVTRQ